VLECYDVGREGGVSSVGWVAGGGYVLRYKINVVRRDRKGPIKSAFGSGYGVEGKWERV